MWLVALQTGKTPVDIALPESAETLEIRGPRAPPQHHDDPQEHLQPQLLDQAGAAQDAVAWVVWNQTQRLKARQFLATEPTGMLVICTVSLELAVHVLHVIEHVSSENFSRQQDLERLSGNHAHSRVAELCGDKLCMDAFRLANELWEDSARYGALPLLHRTWTMQNVAFTLVASTAAALEAYVFKGWRGFPFCLFRLLGAAAAHERVAVAQEVLALPSCLRDAFSQRFLTRFSTSELLCSRHCLALLQSVLARLKLDIIAVECRHASVRRLQRNRAATHMADIADVSGEFFLQTFRRLGAVLDAVSLEQSLGAKAAKHIRFKKKKKRKRCSLRRAGGAARECIAEVLRSLQSQNREVSKREAFRLAHARYSSIRASGGPEYAALLVKGALSKRLAKAGVRKPCRRKRSASMTIRGPLKQAKAVLLPQSVDAELVEHDVWHEAYVKEKEEELAAAISAHQRSQQEQKKAETKTEEKLRQWSHEQHSRNGCSVFPELPRLASPSGHVDEELQLSSEMFLPPIPDYIQAVLTAQKPAISHQDLQRLWHAKHLPIKHSHCPPARLHRVHPPLRAHTLCYKVGFCTCGNTRQKALVASVLGFLRPLFKKGAAL